MKAMLIIVGVSAALCVAAAVYPVHGGLSKTATIAGLLGLLATLGMQCRRRRFLRVGLAIAISACVGAVVFSARPWDCQPLRARYAANLRAYDGTRYVYGGEGALGIDCSGLPRRAYRDALLSEGMRTVNGSLISAWLDQWWNDAGAHAMAEGADGRLVPLTPGPDLQDSFQPGDVAVVNGDTHVVVFLGDGQWAEADPDAAKVIIHDQKSEGRAFLGLSPKFFRWRELTR